MYIFESIMMNDEDEKKSLEKYFYLLFCYSWTVFEW